MQTSGHALWGILEYVLKVILEGFSMTLSFSTVRQPKIRGTRGSASPWHCSTDMSLLLLIIDYRIETARENRQKKKKITNEYHHKTSICNLHYFCNEIYFLVKKRFKEKMYQPKTDWSGRFIPEWTQILMRCWIWWTTSIHFWGAFWLECFLYWLSVAESKNYEWILRPLAW